MSNNILTAFNDHFAEFVADIQNVFPEDPDILTAKNALLTIRKANPKMIVKIWNTTTTVSDNAYLNQSIHQFKVSDDVTYTAHKARPK